MIDAPGTPAGRREVPALWAGAWALVAAALAAAIALGPLAGIPHVQDEVVYTWQAERLAEGRLFAPVPEPRAAHVYDFLLDTPRGRVGIFPLGWPLVLALGALAGAPALVNPLLTGLAVLLGTALAARLGGREAALAAAPWLALSPQALLLGASRMSHPLAAVLALAALLLALGRGVARTPHGLALGGALGGLALARPLDALVVAALSVPLALYRRCGTRYAAGIAAGLALGALAVGLQNHAMTGSAFEFAQGAYFEKSAPPAPGDGFRFAPGCNDLGFGADRGCFPTWGSYGHTPEKAWLDFARNARLAARLWLGSPWAWVLLLAALALPVARKAATLALALGAGLATAYALYWYGGSCYGARFWHVALAPMVIAAATCAAALLRRFRLIPWLALVLLVPMALRLARALPELEAYWGIDDRFARLEREWKAGPVLMLVAYRSELRLTRPRETTGEDLLTAPHRWRAAWFPSSGEIAFAEFHPQLIDAVALRHPGRGIRIYEMAADAKEDRIRALEASDRFEPQLRDLPLPTRLPLLPAPRRAGDTWSGSYRVVEVSRESIAGRAPSALR